MRNGLAFRKHTGATFLSLLQSAIAMGKDDDMTAAQAIMSANAPMIIQKAMVDGEPALGCAALRSGGGSDRRAVELRTTGEVDCY